MADLEADVENVTKSRDEYMDNYQHELQVHADSVSELTEMTSKYDTTATKITILKSEKKMLERQVKALQTRFDTEWKVMEAAQNTAQQEAQSLKKENKLLHAQMVSLNAQFNKSMGSSGGLGAVAGVANTTDNIAAAAIGSTPKNTNTEALVS